MSYHVNLKIDRLDVHIPFGQEGDAIKALEEAGFDEVLVKNGTGLAIVTPEEDEVLVGQDENSFTINKSTFEYNPFGGNHNYFGNCLEILAKKFNGTYDAIAVGEDGESWPTRIVGGVVKKVSLQVVEED